MRQLRVLGVIRTNNNPIGDIAEAIVCDQLLKVKEPPSVRRAGMSELQAAS
ncbi:MAG: hypothetical protein ACREMY_33465 [bacterium]